MDFMELIASEIIERIKTHLSPKELEDLGFSISTVSSWKQHNTIPKTEALYKISKAIGVSMEYLLTGVSKDKLSDEDAAIIALYRSIPSDKQKLFYKLAKCLID